MTPSSKIGHVSLQCVSRTIRNIFFTAVSTNNARAGAGTSRRGPSWCLSAAAPQTRSTSLAPDASGAKKSSGIRWVAPPPPRLIDVRLGPLLAAASARVIPRLLLLRGEGVQRPAKEITMRLDDYLTTAPAATTAAPIYSAKGHRTTSREASRLASRQKAYRAFTRMGNMAYTSNQGGLEGGTAVSEGEPTFGVDRIALEAETRPPCRALP